MKVITSFKDCAERVMIIENDGIVEFVRDSRRNKPFYKLKIHKVPVDVLMKAAKAYLVDESDTLVVEGFSLTRLRNGTFQLKYNNKKIYQLSEATWFYICDQITS